MFKIIMKIRNLVFYFLELIIFLFLLSLVAFFEFFKKRNSKTWLFYGRNGEFFDNSKYLALWISKNVKDPPRVKFVHNMNNPPIVPNIKFVKRGSWSEIFYLMRAGNIIIDDVDQLIRGRRIFLCGNARLIQLWHGVFLKRRIELISHGDRLKKLSPVKRYLLELQVKLTRRFPVYEIFTSTSEYYTREVFGDAFNAKIFLNCGYPRNDYLISPEKFSEDHVIQDGDKSFFCLIKELKQKKDKKIILYAPTFRGKNGKVEKIKGVSTEDFYNHAERANCVWLIKPHPWDSSWGIPRVKKNNLFILSKSTDIYPILHLVDILVSDYSSICYDFLLFDRPMIFFPYDRKDYVDRDENIMFNYDDRTPGEKVYKKEQLFFFIDQYLSNEDDVWQQERKRILGIAFDNVESTACETIYKKIKNISESYAKD